MERTTSEQQPTPDTSAPTAQQGQDGQGQDGEEMIVVVGPDGRVTHVMRPFAELSQDSYAELREAVAKARAGN